MRWIRSCRAAAMHMWDIEERLNNKEIMNDVIYKIGKGIR